MSVPIYTLALNQSGNQTLIQPGTPVGSLTVLTLPSGLTLALNVGSVSIPIWYKGQVIRFCGGNVDGITVTLPVGLTGVLQVALNLEIESSTPDSPQGVASYVGGATLASAGNGAGQGSVLVLTNPPTSGVSLLLRAAGITASVATLETLSIAANPANNPTTSNITPRMPGMPASKAVWKAANAVAFPGGVTPGGFLAVIGGSGLKAVLDPLPGVILVPPGSGVQHAGSLGSNGVNMISSLAWDEV